jgi:hypothetical protein
LLEPKGAGRAGARARLQQSTAPAAACPLQVGSSGLATGLYEQKLGGAGAAVGLTGQLDLLDLRRPPRVGLALQLVQ